MRYENWLHIGALDIKTPSCPPLRGHIVTDCLVIGAGFAGLHAALRLADAGKNVVLVEKNICGGSSSGQSAGFLTPESEEDMRQIVKHYGERKAKIIYNIPLSGVQLIVDTARKYRFNCDLRKQDSFYFSTKKRDNKNIEEEAEYREENDMPYKIFKKEGLKKVHPGKNYLLGMRYSGSYGINSFAYCQEMKNLLLKMGVKIFEGSEVYKINGKTAETHLGNVTADNIILCVDKLKAELNEEFSKKFHTYQTYLAISEPLTDQEVKDLFPNGELMCWDTNMIYIHYRLIDGNRILIGGGNLLTTYSSNYDYSQKTIDKFINNLKDNFPTIKDVEFTHYWSGMLDITKDLIPIVDWDPRNKFIQYVMGCAGLNWAAYCGDYAARRVISKKTEDLTEFLGANRKFFISENLQKFLGKRVSFALSNLKKLLG